VRRVMSGDLSLRVVLKNLSAPFGAAGEIAVDGPVCGRLDDLVKDFASANGEGEPPGGDDDVRFMVGESGFAKGLRVDNGVAGNDYLLAAQGESG